MLLKPTHNLKAGDFQRCGVPRPKTPAEQEEKHMGNIIPLTYDFAFKRLFLNGKIRKGFISDVLGIPPDEIRSVRLANPFLWKRHYREKQGILDVLMEVNGDRRVNVEMQVRVVACWDGRSLFYLAKLFTERLLAGEDYSRLKRCICISVLGFDLDDGPEYHRVYRMRDEKGRDFSDLLEIHVIELNKPLSGRGIDDWIRLFKAKTEEEITMLETETKNPGILEAIKEVREMGLGRALRWIREAKLKEIRDRNARDAYVRMEGEELLNRLNRCLVADKRYDDLERSIEDKEYREQLYKEYGIK